MKKIFVPCEKREATARGFWKNPDGVFFRDFIRYELKEKLTDKILKEYCRTYKQEAIFYEAINNKSGKTNTGTCFFASGKKDVYNRKVKFYVNGIFEAKSRIRELKKRGIEAYTIEKLSGKLEFVIFTWRKSTAKNRQKRILRRNALIKKLIVNLADGKNIRYRIQKNINSGGRYNVYSNKVTISPYNIRHYRINAGYTNTGDYYINRGNKINPYILRNYKNCLRFIIWHEIGHAIFAKKYCTYKNFTKWHFDIARREKYADNYALRQLKRYIDGRSKKDFAGRVYTELKGKRLIQTGQKTFVNQNLNEAEAVQVLYHYSNISLKHNEALTPDNFGNNYFTQNDVNACNFKRLFFYTVPKPEALLAGSRFLYTCRIEAKKIYNITADASGYLAKYASIYEAVRHIAKKYSGISYIIGKNEIVNLFKSIVPNKKIEA